MTEPHDSIPDSLLENLERKDIFSVAEFSPKYEAREDEIYSREELVLGNLALRKGFITDAQLEACLKEQLNTDQQLGRILVGKNFLTEEQLVELLKEQRTLIQQKLQLADGLPMLCKRCGRAYLLKGVQTVKVYRCPKCKGVLLLRKKSETVSNYDTTQVPLTETGLPEEIKAALQGDNETIGKFLLLGKVGQGGGGSVFRAFDMELERIVALKVFSVGSEIDIERTRVEAQLVAKLQHPGIPKLFESGVEGETHFIAMEFIDGSSVAQTSLTIAEAVRICKEAARVLSYAHSEGVIHRDVKPSNILVDKNGNVWLTDFGIAKVTRPSSPELTRTGEIMGTPQFMSPEQALGKSQALDARTDVFSLGSTLYYLLTGATPFEGKTLLEVIHAVYTTEPAVVSSLNARVPKELEAVVSKSMEKDKGMRYQSASDFGEDLDRFLKGEAVTARPVGLVDKVTRKIKKNRKTAIFVACAVIAFAGAAMIALNEYFQRKTASTSADVSEKKRKELETTKDQMLNMFIMQVARAHEDALDARKRGEGHDALMTLAKRAFETYSEIEKLGVKDARVHHSLGRLYRIIDDEREALVQQQKALAVDANYGPAHYECGILLFNDLEKQIEQALEDWMRNPSNEGKRRPRDEEIKTPEVNDLRERVLSHFGSAESTLPRYSSEKMTSEAMKAIVAGKLADAKEMLRSVLARDSSFEDAVYHLSTIAEKEGDMKGAHEIIENGLLADKGNVSFYLKRAGIGFRLSSMRHYRGEDPSESCGTAIADLDAATRLHSKNAQAFLLRGIVRNQLAVYFDTTGREAAPIFEKSIADFKTAGALDPLNYRLWSEHGSTLSNYANHLRRIGLPADKFFLAALNCFEMAIEINKKNPFAWSRRGNVRFNMGIYEQTRGSDPMPDFQKAIADVEHSLELDSAGFEGWLFLANINSEVASYKVRKGLDPEKNFSESERCYITVEKYLPGYFKMFLNLGEMLRNWANYRCRHGKDFEILFERSLGVLTEAIRLNPQRPDCYVARGEMYSSRATAAFRAGKSPEADVEAATKDFNTAITINDKNPAPWSSLGSVTANVASFKLESGENPEPDFAEALKFLDRALELQPGSPALLALRGRTRYNLALYKRSTRNMSDEDFKGADADLTRALEAGPLDSESFVCRASVRMNLAMLKAAMRQVPDDEFNSAQKDLDRALLINPNSPEAYRTIGYLNFNRGLYYEDGKVSEKAVVCYGNAITAWSKAQKIMGISDIKIEKQLLMAQERINTLNRQKQDY